MALPSGTPPLLLTKRLSAFLHANQSPQLPSLLLTTHHGKLLAHASPHPVSLLRTHATVAASLLAIHTTSSVAVPSALPGGAHSPDVVTSSPEADNEGEEEEAVTAPKKLAKSVKPVTITVQLSGGTVVLRRLKCGLLFVCIGPPAAEASATDGMDNSEPSAVSASPSEVDSLMSAGGQTTTSLESAGASTVVAMRRHAAELARWLDDKLGSLKVPEADIGIE